MDDGDAGAAGAGAGAGGTTGGCGCGAVVGLVLMVNAYERKPGLYTARASFSARSAAAKASITLIRLSPSNTPLYVELKPIR